MGCDTSPSAVVRRCDPATGPERYACLTRAASTRLVAGLVLVRIVGERVVGATGPEEPVPFRLADLFGWVVGEELASPDQEHRQAQQEQEDGKCEVRDCQDGRPDDDDGGQPGPRIAQHDLTS